jgi:hypothetical protein
MRINQTIKSYIIKNLREMFEDEVNQMGVHKTPGTSRFKILFSDNSSKINENRLQKIYQGCKCFFIEKKF